MPLLPPSIVHNIIKEASPMVVLFNWTFHHFSLIYELQDSIKGYFSLFHNPDITTYSGKHRSRLYIYIFFTERSTLFRVLSFIYGLQDSMRRYFSLFHSPSITTTCFMVNSAVMEPSCAAWQGTVTKKSARPSNAIHHTPVTSPCQRLCPSYHRPPVRCPLHPCPFSFLVPLTNIAGWVRRGAEREIRLRRLSKLIEVKWKIKR